VAAGVYLHIPFCRSRCSYCDFATEVWRSNETVERYVNALCSEIKTVSFALTGGDIPIDSISPADHSAGIDIDTIYFGGGTPSLLKPEQVERILEAVNIQFEISNDAEITMEMNPATVTPESLAAYRSFGVNRASFGVQTFNDKHLKLLARGHDSNDARQTLKMLRDAGFDNISFDLIAGLPGQTLDDWKLNLEKAVSMQPEHLSLYLLEIHEGTPLADQVRSGRRPLPDPELGAEMYEFMLDELGNGGYEQYEISNFAKPGFESRHNSKYWRLEPVYGFGVSAHSFDGLQRYSNERDTNRFVQLIEKFGTAETERETVDAPSEFAFLGLRLNQGIDLDEYRARFRIDLFKRYGADLDQRAAAGLIEISGGKLRLTRKGMLFSNEVFEIFVSGNASTAEAV
jgi:oxygen-independent coproporphyrinogen-3 oxidase